MARPSNARPRSFYLTEINELPVAAGADIWEGAACGVDPATGYARTLQGGDDFVGFAVGEANNSTGIGGRIRVRVRSAGLVRLPVPDTSTSSVRRPVYASDDNTFTLTPTGNSYVGVIDRVEENGFPVVFFGSNEAPVFRKGLLDITQRFGARGNGTSLDTDALVSALEQAAELGGGIVLVPPGHYLYDQRLDIPANTTLHLMPGATINCTANEWGIWLSDRGSRIQGAGTLHMTNASLTKGGLYISDKHPDTGLDVGIPYFRKGVLSYVSGIRIIGTLNQHYGTGIYMLANNSDGVGSSVNWVHLSNLNLHDWNAGIYLHAIEADNGQEAFVNGNTFMQIAMEDCIDFIRLRSEGAGVPAVNSNMFHGFQFQVDTDTQSIVKMEDAGGGFGPSRNVFTAFSPFDFNVAAGTYAIDIGTDCAKNMFFGVGGTAPAEIRDLGINNVIIDAEGLLIAPTESEGTTLSDSLAAAHPGRIVATSTGFAVSNGTHWVRSPGVKQQTNDVSAAAKTFTQAEMIDGMIWRMLDGSTTDQFEWDIGTNAQPGCIVHIQNRSVGEKILIKPSAFARIWDGDSQSTANGKGLILDARWGEVKLECTDGLNWAVHWKRPGQTYTWEV